MPSGSSCASSTGASRPPPRARSPAPLPPPRRGSPARSPPAAGCSPRSVRAARDACHALGVPHFGLDLRQEFRRDVVDDFLGGFRAGLTPNPCVRCNGGFRFAALAEFADRVGAPRLATGHYARVRRRDGRTLLVRGADPAKDQSYMLASVPCEILERCWFPLGEQTKTQTWTEAGSARPAAARPPRGQGVC